MPDTESVVPNTSGQVDAAAPERAPACPHCHGESANCGCTTCPSCVYVIAEGGMCDVCDTCRDSCCGCWECRSCDRRYASDSQHNCCSECEQCEHCCSCWTCDGCGSTMSENDNRCQRCEQCNDCCECSNERDTLRGDAHLWHGESDRSLPLYVSVEMEVISMKPGTRTDVIKVLKKWGGSLKEDASLNEGGFEIGTAPARGQMALDQVDSICKKLVEKNAMADRSCGLHCHVDARNMSDESLLCLIRLYRVVEPALYDMVAGSRRENHHCKYVGSSLSHTLQLGYSVSRRIEFLKEELYGSVDAADEAKQDKRKRSCRYAGLNLNALYVHGTIEFRMHHGTVDATKVKHWMKVCSAIVQYAESYTESEISKNFDGVSPIEALCSIVPPETSIYIVDRTNYFRSKRGAAPVSAEC